MAAKAYIKRIAPCDPKLSVVYRSYRSVEEDDTVESSAILNLIASREAQQSLREEIMGSYEDFQSSAIY